MITFRFPLLNLFNSKQILFFLWLFLLVFPKGGIKVGGIPVTWGYLLLGIAFLFASFRKSWKIQSPRLQALLCLAPFQVVTALTMLHNGVGSMGWTISFFTTFFFLPWAFFVVFSRDIENMDLNLFYDFLKKGIVFISYYGIFLFVYRKFMGKYLEIPFLTVNLGDLGTLDEGKFNNRGFISKLISTYNNGQLFGISMLILLPLYCYVQKNFWHRLAIKLALILTLSRTTWIGLVFHEILYNLLVIKDKRKSIRNLAVIFCVLLGGGAFLAVYHKFFLMFLFDSNLGGRRYQLEVLENASLFSSKAFTSFTEIAYLTILDFFGIAGLIAYLIAMGGPILFYLSPRISKPRLCIVLGLINYLFISGSDGAILYIPVLAFFWFFVSLLARKNLDDPFDKGSDLSFKRSHIPLRSMIR